MAAPSTTTRALPVEKLLPPAVALVACWVTGGVVVAVVGNGESGVTPPDSGLLPEGTAAPPEPGEAAVVGEGAVVGEAAAVAVGCEPVAVAVADLVVAA